MQTYLVGGAVRDQLLNLPVNEHDWVVVGASVKEMQALGYKQVGRDFPVFIHPKSGEEYALARTERKTAKGHTGFIVHSSPEITLQEDLLRRDLTINAIAQDEHGTLIDPYNGQQDLENRVLRHVSSAFAEDPLRVLRVARFAAKLHHLEFKIHADTLQLMQSIAESGELQHLSSERIWQETRRALETANPETYFFSLLECGALEALLPELAHALSIKEKRQQLSQLNMIAGIEARYVALAAVASMQAQNFAIDVVTAINQFFCSPRNLQEICTLSIKHLPAAKRALTSSSGDVHTLLKQLDAFRRADRYTRILDCMRSVSTVLEHDTKAALDFLDWLQPQLVDIKPADKTLQSLHGPAIAEAVEKSRCAAIDSLRAQYIK